MILLLVNLEVAVKYPAGFCCSRENLKCSIVSCIFNFILFFICKRTSEKYLELTTNIMCKLVVQALFSTRSNFSVMWTSQKRSVFQYFLKMLLNVFVAFASLLAKCPPDFTYMYTVHCTLYTVQKVFTKQSLLCTDYSPTN